jgi:hypothetical protein
MMGFWVGNAWPLCFHLFSFAFSILGFVLVVFFFRGGGGGGGGGADTSTKTTNCPFFFLFLVTPS